MRTWLRRTHHLKAWRWRHTTSHLHALRHTYLCAHRYASLYFLACVDDDDNELIVLETIHHFVEVLDRYFGNVCELDLIFNFHKVRAQMGGVRVGAPFSTCAAAQRPAVLNA